MSVFIFLYYYFLTFLCYKLNFIPVFCLMIYLVFFYIFLGSIISKYNKILGKNLLKIPEGIIESLFLLSFRPLIFKDYLTCVRNQSFLLYLLIFTEHKITIKEKLCIVFMNIFSLEPAFLLFIIMTFAGFFWTLKFAFFLYIISYFYFMKNQVAINKNLGRVYDFNINPKLIKIIRKKWYL